MTTQELEGRQRVGAWMKAAREKRELSMTDVAMGVGVTPQSVRWWEAGRWLPRLDVFGAWCRSVFIEPDEAMRTVELLLGGDA